MLKLTCGLSKKVGEANYGSRRATVAVEVELDAVALRQPEKLKAHIRCAFDRVREAIEEELARPGPQRLPTGAAEPPSVGDRPRPSRNGARPVTANQLRALRAIAGRPNGASVTAPSRPPQPSRSRKVKAVTQWEYETLVVGAEAPGLPNLTGGQVDAAALSRELNRLGLHGWELVTAIDTNYVRGATRDGVLLFKRPAAAADLREGPT